MADLPQVTARLPSRVVASYPRWVNGAGIPTGLGTLLKKLGLILKVDKPNIGAQANVPEGKRGAQSAKRTQGDPLVDEGTVRVGLGYGGEDLRTSRKNVSEQKNVGQFLKETQGGRHALGAHDTSNAAREAWDSVHDALNPFAEAMAEPHEAALPREEARQEARLHAHRETTEAEPPMVEIEPEAEDKRQPEDQDEEEKPGGGWVAEELEGEEDDEPPRNLRSADVLDEQNRCRHGLLEGDRCLRRAVKGTPYCRAHAASVPQGPTFDRE